MTRPVTPNLINGEVRNQLHPTTFEIPSREIRDSLQPGDYVKIGLEKIDQTSGEKFWVEVQGKSDDGIYIAAVKNDLVRWNYVCDDAITFRAEHVLCEPLRT
jgi:hypothetical protein